MGFIDTIFSIVWSISDNFRVAYLVVKDWVWPFYYLQYALLVLRDLFWSLLTPIAHLGAWVADVAVKVSNVLSYENIASYFQWFFSTTQASWDWITSFVANPGVIINAWWSSVGLTVQGWINIAIEQAQSLAANVVTQLANLQTTWDNFWTLTWPQWTGKLGNLEAAWGSFWTVTFPTLATWSGVSALIDSTMKSWFPFYDDLINIWGDIAGFFADPLGWVADRLEDWFWGPEEL